MKKFDHPVTLALYLETDQGIYPMKFDRVSALDVQLDDVGCAEVFIQYEQGFATFFQNIVGYAVIDPVEVVEWDETEESNVIDLTVASDDDTIQ